MRIQQMRSTLPMGSLYDIRSAVHFGDPAQLSVVWRRCDAGMVGCEKERPYEGKQCEFWCGMRVWCVCGLAVVWLSGMKLATQSCGGGGAGGGRARRDFREVKGQKGVLSANV